MSFSIKFIDEPIPKNWLQPGEKAVLGVIEMEDDFKERLKISTFHWSKQDYIKHWIEASNVLISGKIQKTILCTDIADTTKVGYSVECWALYRDGDSIYVNNFYEPANKKMYSTNLDELLKLLPKKRYKKGSEWVIAVSDLEQWMKSLRGDIR